jgi:NAD-dependent deacetylase
MRVVVFTGAGVSRESGLLTFRDTDGLWEGHRIEDVAVPSAWRKDPVRVLDFYNQRRRDVLAAQPNPAHRAIASLEAKHEVLVVTQNIDDLHERAGSTNVLHLHGEIFKVRSERNEGLILPWTKDVQLGDLAPDGAQLRPHIVWFEEAVLGMGEATEAAWEADAFLVVGTSLNVFPAAGLVDATRAPTRILVDPSPPELYGRRASIQVVAEVASIGVPKVVEELLKA